MQDSPIGALFVGERYKLQAGRFGQFAPRGERIEFDAVKPYISCPQCAVRYIPGNRVGEQVVARFCGELDGNHLKPAPCGQRGSSVYRIGITT